MKTNITDWDIQALVDNEMPEDEARRVKAELALYPDLQRRYADLIAQKKMLCAWWDHHKSET